LEKKSFHKRKQCHEEEEEEEQEDLTNDLALPTKRRKTQAWSEARPGGFRFFAFFLFCSFFSDGFRFFPL
jgi:hypothetical protein